MNNIDPCEKCGHKLITLTGMMHLDADVEPYVCGQYEDVELTMDEAMHALYCEECEKFDSIWLAEWEGGFVPTTSE